MGEFLIVPKIVSMMRQNRNPREVGQSPQICLNQSVKTLMDKNFDFKKKVKHKVHHELSSQLTRKTPALL